MPNNFVSVTLRREGTLSTCFIIKTSRRALSQDKISIMQTQSKCLLDCMTRGSIRSATLRRRPGALALSGRPPVAI
jgi:hypothetical protein